MNDETVTKLREPFPPHQVGKLPRVTCKECSDKKLTCQRHQRARCDVCKAFVSTQHIHLDYVGHAEVTDRLLSVDPEWSWEPVSFDASGLPAIAPGASGGWVLWIRLTVAGVTRLGVGSVAGGNDVEKQLVSDALRNAAMRFGVALNLWAKTELEAPAGVDQETGEVTPKSSTVEVHHPGGQVTEVRRSTDNRPKRNAYEDKVKVEAARVGMTTDALDALLESLALKWEDITRENAPDICDAIREDVKSEPAHVGTGEDWPS